MTQQLIKQPNDLWAVFSTVTDAFVMWDCTEGELLSEAQKIQGMFRLQLNYIERRIAEGDVQDNCAPSFVEAVGYTLFGPNGRINRGLRWWTMEIYAKGRSPDQAMQELNMGRGLLEMVYSCIEPQVRIGDLLFRLGDLAYALEAEIAQDQRNRGG